MCLPGQEIEGEVEEEIWKKKIKVYCVNVGKKKGKKKKEGTASRLVIWMRRVKLGMSESKDKM